MSSDPKVLAESLYAAVVAPEKWPELLGRIAQASGGLGAIVVPLTQGLDLLPVWSSSLDESAFNYVREGWWERDTRAERGRALGLTSGVHLDWDIVGQDRMSRDPFYQEFLPTYGFGCSLSQVATVPGGSPIAITVQRRAADGVFATTERERLEFLGKHAARAMAAALSVGKAERALHAEQTARAHLAHGYIILDATGGVLHADRLGGSLLGPVFGLRNNRLFLKNSRHSRIFDQMVGSAGAGCLPLSPIAVARPGSHRPDLILQAVPITLGSEWAWARHGRVLVLIHDLGAEASAKTQAQLMALGLTPGQAKIAECIGSGKTPREAAETFGLAEATVRTVLKAIFERLGIRRQSELAALTTKLQQVL
ncbi:helix-turn-helix transcriptional regulator [Alsobacter sp. SYSU BS001988]